MRFTITRILARAPSRHREGELESVLRFLCVVEEVFRNHSVKDADPPTTQDFQRRLEKAPVKFVEREIAHPKFHCI